MDMDADNMNKTTGIGFENMQEKGVHTEWNATD